MTTSAACERSEPTTRSAPPSPAPPVAAKLVMRIDIVDHADDCDARATLVYVGFDRDGDGRLSDAERVAPPMVFCTADPLAAEIVEAAPNHYCPRRNRVVKITGTGVGAELVVCLDPAEHEIESTYSVYS